MASGFYAKYEEQIKALMPEQASQDTFDEAGLKIFCEEMSAFEKCASPHHDDADIVWKDVGFDLCNPRLYDDFMCSEKIRAFDVCGPLWYSDEDFS